MSHSIHKLAGIVFLVCCGIAAHSQDARGLRPDLKDTSGIVLNYVDVMPGFTGGADAWRRFLVTNLRPNIMLDMMKKDRKLNRTGINERVIVEFVVCEDGGICNLRIANKDSVHQELAAEALRVMRLSPAWTPGAVNGEKVKVYFRQPILFKVD